MTGSLTRANALPPPMSPSLASSLAPRQKPLTNAWLVTTLPAIVPKRVPRVFCVHGLCSLKFMNLHCPGQVAPAESTPNGTSSS